MTVIHDIEVTEHLVMVPTRMCIVCGKTGHVAMSAGSWSRWAKGYHVQDAAPHMPVEMREQLVSGIHPGCWTEMFGEEDDDEQE